MAHSIVVDLIAKTGGFVTDLDRAAKQAKKSAADIEKAFVGLKSGLVALTGGLTFAGLVAGTKNVIDGVDALNDLSDATGASVENLSALEDIALRTGTSMETAGDAIVKLNKALGDAKPDSDAGRAFKALNLDIKELKALDPVEAFQKVAIALSGFADDGNKARLTQELFGKSLKEVAPLLKDAAEAGTLHAKVTKAQATEAEEFNKRVFELSKNLMDLGRQAIIPLLDPLAAIVEYMRDGTKEGGAFAAVASMLRVTFEAIAILVANVAFVFKAMGREIGAIAAQAVSLGKLDIQGFNAISDAVKEDGIRARAELDKFEARILRLGEYDPVSSAIQAAFLRGDDPGERRPSAPDVTRVKVAKTKDAKFEFADAVEDFLDRIKAGDELKLSKLLDTLEQFKTFIAGGGTVPDSVLAQLAEDIAKVTPAARDAKKALDLLAGTTSGKFDAMLKDIAEINRLFAAGLLTVEQWAEAIRTRTGTADDGLDKLKDKLAATPTGKMNAMLEEIEFIHGQFAAGAITVEQWAELLRVATGTTEDGVEKVSDAAKDLGMTFSSAFEDAIVEGEKLGDVLKALEKDLLRIVWRKLVTEPMAAWISQVATTAGSAFGNWMGGSSAVPDNFNPPVDYRAGGGPVLAGEGYMVGERGPELFRPYTAGRVLPNDALGGGAPRVEVVNNLGPRAEPEVSRGPEGALRIVLNAVAEDTRRGGVTARATAGRFGVNNGAMLNRRRG